MRARMNIGPIKPGKKGEAIAFFKDTLGPAVSQVQANVGSLSMIDHAEDNAIAISFWPSEADLTGNPPDSFIDVSIVDQVLGPRVSGGYDVDVRGDMSKSGSATHARTNRRQIQPGKMDGAISEYRDSVIPAVRSRKGFVGGLLLSDRDNNTTLAISLWDSEADMLANQPLGPDALSVGSTVRTECEVTYVDLD